MKIKLKDINGITLKTKDKVCTEDIEILVDESIGSAEIPEGYIKPTGTYDVIDNGEYDITNYAKVNVNVASSGGDTNTLKKLLDLTKSCYYMFYGNSTITDLTGYISYNDTSNVTTMYYMFYNCSSLTAIPQLNTSNVTNMSGIFYGCSKLTTIPQLDTSKVTNMYYMFNGCSSLTAIPQLNTSNVTNMQYTFSGCQKLTTIPQLDTSKVTDMSSTFQNCTLLTTIPQLNTSNVTYMGYMFYNCSSLTTILQLDTSKVTNMYYMFNGCSSLTAIPQLDTIKATNMGYMFYKCFNLTTIDITHYKISSTGNSAYWCRNCYSLKAIIIRSFGTSYALNSNAFNDCYHILGTVDSTYNPTGAKDGFIYIPRNMVNTLKSATNWSTYADQIRALEDYTVDGTTTGELDESKVNA